MIRLLAILWIAVLAFPVHAEEEIHRNFYGVSTGKTVIENGRQVHYNVAGQRIGHSVVNGGRETHYDAAGRRTGHSTVNSQGKTDFDYYGTRTGKQVDGIEYDRMGRRVGSDKLEK